MDRREAFLSLVGLNLVATSALFAGSWECQEKSADHFSGGIIVKNGMRLMDAIKKLAWMEKREYIVENESLAKKIKLKIPCGEEVVRNFYELSDLLKEGNGYVLVVTKNMYSKSKPKIVRVVTYEEYKKSYMSSKSPKVTPLGKETFVPDGNDLNLAEGVRDEGVLTAGNRFDVILDLLEKARYEASKVEDKNFAKEAFMDDIRTLIEGIKNFKKGL